MNTSTATVAQPRPRTAPLRLVRGGGEQLALPYEYDIAPGVPAIPPVSPIPPSTPNPFEGLPDPRVWTERLARACAEVAIGTYMTTYLTQSNTMGLTLAKAGSMVAWYWGGATIGRFFGSFILAKVSPGKVLTVASLAAIVLILVSAFSVGPQAGYALIAIGFFVILMRAKKQVEMTVESESTRAQLEHASKLASVGELAAGIAHEINNPLATILSAALMLRYSLGLRFFDLWKVPFQRLRNPRGRFFFLEEKWNRYEASE